MGRRAEEEEVEESRARQQKSRHCVLCKAPYPLSQTNNPCPVCEEAQKKEDEEEEEDYTLSTSQNGTLTCMFVSMYR